MWYKCTGHKFAEFSYLGASKRPFQSRACLSGRKKFFFKKFTKVGKAFSAQFCNFGYFVSTECDREFPYETELKGISSKRPRKCAVFMTVVEFMPQA